MPEDSITITADEFTRAYIEAALWSSTDDEGRPPDSLDVELSDELRELMFIEARLFQIKASPFYSKAMSEAQAGHDFWLTRNGHGAGFWDRSLPDNLGEILTAMAHAFGECSLYIGDDGKLYA
jgi:hypothetical protein